MVGESEQGGQVNAEHETRIQVGVAQPRRPRTLRSIQEAAFRNMPRHSVRNESRGKAVIEFAGHEAQTRMCKDRHLLTAVWWHGRRLACVPFLGEPGYCRYTSRRIGDAGEVYVGNLA